MKSIIKYSEFRKYLFEKTFKNLIALSCTKEAFKFLQKAPQITDFKINIPQC